ncbi:MAG: protein translocase subunit SecD [Alphaproteobacteria bacterium]
MLRIQPVKTILILGVIFIAFLYALPNTLPEKVRGAIPKWLPHEMVNLGLDLRGGSHLLFSVNVEEVYKQRMLGLEGDIRQNFVKERIGYSGLNGNKERVTVKLRDVTQMDEAYKKVRDLGQTLGGASDIMVEKSADGVITATLTEAAKIAMRNRVLDQAIEVVRRRIDATGAKEPIIQRQGADRIVVDVPGESDPERIKALVSKTARLTFQSEDTSVSLEEAVSGHVPPRSKVYKFRNPKEGGGRTQILLEERAVITGDMLREARSGQDEYGQAAVNFTLNTQGARKFGEYSSSHIGHIFAIVLDDEVISAPVIRGAILGGSGQISGGFKSIQEAEDLALLLRAGALPASMKAEASRTIGAELGADSVKAGITASMIGSIAVVLFMFVAYGQFGVIANVALLANVIIMLGVITALRATLTLPGIAGIVLTVGMAVDSNVLIYERIKEELRAGRSMIASLEAGFTRAFGTILDANLTTLIASIILFILGAGPVRGFAIAHAVGTLTTIFTAYTFSRLLVAVWFNVAKPKRIPIDTRPLPDGRVPFHLIPTKFNIPFMRTHMFGFLISGAAVLGSIAAPFVLPLNFSIDFKGGTALEIRTQGPADLEKIRNVSNAVGLEGGVQVQEFGSPDDIQLRFANQGAGTPEEQTAAREKLVSALQAGVPKFASVAGFDVVGPAVGAELKTKGIIAVLIGIGLMMVYVWFRFEWQFGLGAVAGLFHDILLTVGIFSLFQIEFNIAIIAALLTIVGYSMNDKVVIYDRIRENLRKYKKMEMRDLIDQSLNETLARTTITAITTLLALFALYFFGGHVIRNFVFAMIWGVFVGTYSSLYISAPFLKYAGVKRDWSGQAQTAKSADKAVKAGA